MRCAAGISRDQTMGWGVETECSLAAAWSEELQALVQAGLVSSPVAVDGLADEPRFPAYVCRAAARPDVSDDDIPASGFGVDPDDALARLKAAGECLETLCGLAVPSVDAGADPDPETTGAVVRELTGLNKDTLDRVLPSLARIPARNPVTGATATLPAQLVSLSARHSAEPQLLPERTSGGLAFGRIGTGRALVSAILEQVERDAAAAAFAQPRRLRRLAELPRPAAALAGRIEDCGLALHVFDITSDLGIPTIACLAVDDSGRGPFLTASAAARLDYATALEKALLEAVQGRSAFRAWEDQIRARDIERPDDIRGGLDRIAWWWDAPARRADLAFYLDRASRLSRVDPTAQLGPNDVFAALRRHGLDLWIADLTLPEIRAAGYETVKAIIPGLHRLHMSEAAAQAVSRHHGILQPDPGAPPHPMA